MPYGTEHDRLVLAVGAVVFVAILGLLAWVVSAPAPTTPTTHASPAAGPTSASDDAATGRTASVNLVRAGAAGGDLRQTLSVSVLPGPLTVSPTSETATLSPSGNGAFRGDLALVTVVDARGSLVGWNASISLQSVDGLSTAQLAGAQLCATPDTPTIVAGNPGEVHAAPPSCGRFGEPVSVFFAPSGGGGGTFTDTAAVTLGLPAGIAVNPASATLAVTVH